MNKIILYLAIILLSGCGTSPVQQVNYYLLSGANTDVNPMIEMKDKERVYIQDVRLAEYLTQSNLSLQLNSHQIHYSRQHAWAESLENGIEKALLHDLNKGSERFYFVGASEPDFDDVSRKIVIQFDHFIATDQSTVIASGTYWFRKNAEGPNYNQKRFNLNSKLTEDGYPHSVKKLRELLQKLSKLIEQDLRD